MSEPDRAILTMTTTMSTCCAETVNSAVSLWTELEVVDEDEDLYTYLTIEQESAAVAAATQQQQRYLPQQQMDRRFMNATSSSSSLRGCLRVPTILPSGQSQEEEAKVLMDVDPKIQWQEEAYWMSFQTAVRTFSDRQARVSTSSYYVSAPAMTTATSVAVSGIVVDDDDTEMSSFQGLHLHHTLMNGGGGDENYGDYDVDDDGIPPCIPRTVVTPTASLGSHSHPSYSGGGTTNNDPTDHHRGGSMSIATASSSSSTKSATRRSAKLPSFSRPQPTSPLPPSPLEAAPKQSPTRDTGEDTQYAEIRRSLRELMAQAAINKRVVASQLQPQCPHSPPRRTAARGDPRFAISSSLAGPNLEEIKGLRWKMKELAEHAAVVAKGEKDAERYVIGASASNSVL